MTPQEMTHTLRGWALGFKNGDPVAVALKRAAAVLDKRKSNPLNFGAYSPDSRVCKRCDVMGSECVGCVEGSHMRSGVTSFGASHE